MVTGGAEAASIRHRPTQPLVTWCACRSNMICEGVVGRYCAYADTHQPPAGAWRAAPNHQRPSAVGHSIAAQRQHQLHCRLHKSPVCVCFKN